MRRFGGIVEPGGRVPALRLARHTGRVSRLVTLRGGLETAAARSACRRTPGVLEESGRGREPIQKTVAIESGQALYRFQGQEKPRLP